MQPRDEKSYRAYKSFFLIGADDRLSDDPPSDSTQKITEVTAMPLADYNALTGENYTLAPGEALIYTDSSTPFTHDQLISGNLTLRLKEIDSPLAEKSDEPKSFESWVVVTPDVETADLFVNNSLSEPRELTYYSSFNLDGSDEAINAFSDSLKQEIKLTLDHDGGGYGVTNRLEMRDEFFATYGGLFFVGILLGFLFLMITVLIIYYKQVSEGYDDRERYEIMQKVGMSRREVKKTIKSQILMVFFLPLVAAFVHIAVAFNVVRQLLLLFAMTNTMLYVGCLVGVALVFAVIYTVVYLVTARAYYRITE